MSADAGNGVFRIGGEGVSSSRFTAVDPGERVALIDRCLASHPDGVMVLELKRDSRPWDEWKRDLGHIEFMRVGLVGDHGAAEYLRAGTRCTDPIVLATHNPAPQVDLPRVPYDACVPLYFPGDMVVPRVAVRELMVDFALHGGWLGAGPWRVRDHLAA